jgi:cobalt-zinc-cadmium efflux system membrane fusion protein
MRAPTSNARRHTPRGLAALCAAALSACSQGAPEAPASGEVSAGSARSAEARWVAVRAPTDLALLEAPARAVAPAWASAEITVLGEARIEGVRVLPGDRVKRGQVVAEVVAPHLAMAAATVGALGRQLELLAARIEELEKLRAEGLARAEELFALREKRAEGEARRAEARAQLAGAAVGAEAEARLASTGRLSLVSPADGVITEVRVRVGDIVAPGGPPLISVRGTGPARVVATVSRRLPAGASPTFVASGGERIALAPTPLAEVVDPGTGAIQLFFEPASPTQLADGTLGRLSVDPGPGVLQVPASALVKRGSTTVVLRAGDAPGAPSAEVEVEVLATSGASALVRGTLEVGAKVALDPARAQAAAAQAGGG